MDANGNPIVNQNSELNTINSVDNKYFDKDGHQYGDDANPNNWLVAPINYHITDIYNAASRITKEADQEENNSNILSPDVLPPDNLSLRFEIVRRNFRDGGDEDLQRTYENSDGTMTHNGADVPMFQDVASFHFGGVSQKVFQTTVYSKLFGSLYDASQQLTNLGSAASKIKNNKRNMNSITGGANYVISHPEKPQTNISRSESNLASPPSSTEKSLPPASHGAPSAALESTKPKDYRPTPAGKDHVADTQTDLTITPNAAANHPAAQPPSAPDFGPNKAPGQPHPLTWSNDAQSTSTGIVLPPVEVEGEDPAPAGSAGSGGSGGATVPPPAPPAHDRHSDAGGTLPSGFIPSAWHPAAAMLSPSPSPSPVRIHDGPVLDRSLPPDDSDRLLDKLHRVAALQHKIAGLLQAQAERGVEIQVYMDGRPVGRAIARRSA